MLHARFRCYRFKCDGVQCSGGRIPLRAQSGLGHLDIPAQRRGARRRWQHRLAAYKQGDKCRGRRSAVPASRKEQQRAQAKEKRKQAEVLRSKDTKRRRQLRATEKAESVCVWTGTVGRNYLFLPFTHSNCIWFDLVPPSFWWLMNLISLYLIYKLLLSPFTIGDRVTQQKNDSLFDKHGISPSIETDLPETGAPGRDSFFQKHGVS